MSFEERGRDESLAEHLLRNAVALQLSIGQRRRLTCAYALTLGTNADKVEAGRIATSVRDELRSDLLAVVKAAEARGEKVSVFNDAGARHVRGRDGIASLAKARSLNDDEVKAALAYRYCYEQAASGLKSVLGAAGEGGGGTTRVPFGVRSAGELQRAYVMARLSQMERAVLARQVTGLELSLLRHVAGEGNTLASAGAGGKAWGVRLDALRRALAAIGSLLPSSGLRIGEH